MQLGEVGPDVCYSCQCVSLVYEVGTWDPTSQEEDTLDSQHPEEGSAAGVAYKADGIARPALRDGTAEAGIAAANAAVGADNDDERWSQLQGMVRGLLSKLASK
jgi:hypothetical protein